MDHYTEKHTSHIVCRDWLRNDCNRVKCWYRHSNLNTEQTMSSVNYVPKQQDFPFLPPSHRPPAQNPVTAQLPAQAKIQNSPTIQQMLAQMAMRMNTLGLGITESHNQMHTLQEMLANK